MGKDGKSTLELGPFGVIEGVDGTGVDGIGVVDGISERPTQGSIVR